MRRSCPQHLVDVVQRVPDGADGAISAIRTSIGADPGGADGVTGDAQHERVLEDAVVSGALCYAEEVPREPRQRAVILCNLDKPAPPDTLPADITDSGEFGGTSCGYQVGAMPVMLEADALTPVPLGAGAGAHLVMLVAVATARDYPAATALVGDQDVLAVQLEDTEPAEGVIG